MKKPKTGAMKKIHVINIMCLILLSTIALILGVLVILNHKIILTYKYTSDNGKFVSYEIPAKGRELVDVEKDFSVYKNKTDKPSLILYRTFVHKDWDDPLMWYDNITNRRWRYPFAKLGRR